MPTNLYGPGDNYHPENSHVIPALIRRFHEAKRQGVPKVVAWGTGKARREFLHVQDMAEASIFVMTLSKAKYESVTEPMSSHINVGSGVNCTIASLTQLIATTVGYKGKIIWDQDKPDGAPIKLLNRNKLEQLGWQSGIDLEEGLSSTYRSYLATVLDGS